MAARTLQLCPDLDQPSAANGTDLNAPWIIQGLVNYMSIQCIGCFISVVH